jgi:acyl carrier protein
MRDRLARHLAEELLGRTNGSAAPLAPDEDLLGGGLLDSLGVMSLVFFIERELGVRVPPEDVTIENFQTLERIDAYVARRRGAGV